MSSCICIITGRLTRDVEFKTLQSGTDLCEFGIAYDTGWGENKKPTFLDCVAWGKTAEFITQYFGKGKPIYLEGEILMESWEDKETMQKRTKHKFNVRNAKFLDQDSSREPVVMVEGSTEASKLSTDPFSSQADDDTPF